MNYTFDWSVLWREPYGSWMVQGILNTLKLGALSWFIALAVGTGVAVGRTVPSRAMRLAAAAYVEIFRNIPLLVQLFFWYYGVPMLFGPRIVRLPNLEYYAAVLGLGLYTASRVAEHLRSGLGSVASGQRAAALSSGMTQFQAYRYVVVPIALRLMIPPLTTEFLTVFKNSSVAMTIGVLETSGAAYHIESYTFHGFETITGAMAVYLAIGLGVVGLMARVESRFRIRGLVARE